MLKLAGVDYAKMPRVKHNGDPLDLVSGKADAMVAYSMNEPFVLEQLGVPYLAFSPRGSGIDFYSDNLVTSEKQIKTHPKRVADFRAASLRGWQYALSHKEEIVDLILRRYSQAKNRVSPSLRSKPDGSACPTGLDRTRLSKPSPLAGNCGHVSFSWNAARRKGA